MQYDPADIRAVQEHFGFVHPAPVEKDWHVMQALAAISTLDASPFRFIFAGGTALARAHKLVRRMSEDVDFKIVLESPEPFSQSARSKRLSALRNSVTSALLNAGFQFDPENPQHLRARNSSQYALYNLPYETTATPISELRPTIQLELTYAPLRLAPVILPVSSFVAEAFGRAPEVTAIGCVNITETAAEKLVALTRRTAMELAGLSRDPDPALVRHIYDLHMIGERIDSAEVVRLAREIAVNDSKEFQNQYPAYAADWKSETRKALSAIKNDPIYRERYASFIRNMVYGETPDFAAAFGTVERLAALLLAD